MNRNEQGLHHESDVRLEAALEYQYCYPVDAESGGAWAGMNDYD